MTGFRQPPEPEENPNSSPPQSPIEPPGWEKSASPTVIGEATNSQQSSTLPGLEKKVSSPTEVEVEVRHSKKPRSSGWDKKPSPLTESQSPPPPPATGRGGFAEQSPINLQKNPSCPKKPAAVLEAWSPTGSDVGQMVCGSCDELVSYPRTAKLVKCPCCGTVNSVLEEHQVGNVKCGRCYVWLMYPNGGVASSVRCSACRFVTEIGDQSRRPPP